VTRIVNLDAYRRSEIILDLDTYNWASDLEDLRVHLARIPRFRPRAGRDRVSWSTLARVVGCSERSLWNYVNGTTEPSGTTRLVLIQLITDMRLARSQAAS